MNWFVKIYCKEGSLLKFNTQLLNATGVGVPPTQVNHELIFAGANE